MGNKMRRKIELANVFGMIILLLVVGFMFLLVGSVMNDQIKNAKLSCDYLEEKGYVVKKNFIRPCQIQTESGKWIAPPRELLLEDKPIRK